VQVWRNGGSATNLAVGLRAKSGLVCVYVCVCVRGAYEGTEAVPPTWQLAATACVL